MPEGTTFEILIPGQPGGDTTRPGRAQAPDADADTPDGLLRPLAEIDVASSRSADAGAVRLDLPSTHLIEVELEDGLVLFRRLETLEGMEGALSRSGEGLPVLPRALDLPDDASRSGLRRLAVRIYRFFDAQAVTDATVTAAARQIEAKLAQPGRDVLHRCDRAGTLTEAEVLAEGQRMAVLIHGTFSNTEGSFGDLVPVGPDGPADSARWSMVFDAFATPPPGIDQAPGTQSQTEPDSHIYAFEHCTLTRSPVQNAIALMEALPHRARLSLLTHSRGGLVGDLISRAARSDSAFDAHDLAIFKAARLKAGHGEAAIAAELDDLQRLSDLLAEKQPRIERFVRVACPARGTTLASDRLERAVSVIFNLMALVPGPQRAFVPVVRRFAQAVVATRTDPGLLPGLEAMAPFSPLVAALNRADVAVDAPLSIVAGDIAARGVLQTLAVLASDLFYGDDHDLVVDTVSMHAGVRRTGPVYQRVESGPEVDHFSYFQNGSTALPIVQALTGAPQEAGFEIQPGSGAPEMALSAPGLARGGAAPRLGARPVVLFLPGIQGSQLGQANGNIVWLDVLEMGLGGIRTIGASSGAPTEGIRSVRSLPRYYNALIRYLSDSHDVIDFHYDWRQSVTTEADRLARELEAVLKATAKERQPVRLVGHSMGGLVARSMIARHRDLWERLHAERPGSRLVMLGTPNGGSMSMAWALMGRDKLLRWLERIDFTTSMPEMLREIQPMPGVLELLPTDMGGQFYRTDAWEARRLEQSQPIPDAAALEAAWQTHQALDLRPEDRARMVYLAGSADVTPVAIEVIGSGEAKRLRLLGTRNGDGRVAWRTGLLPGVRSWYAPDTVHGDLCRDRRLMPAIQDLVMRGETTRLSQSPPASRGADRLFEITPEALIYPGDAELEAAALGGQGETRARGRGDETPARISVTHGDLRSHDGIIALGHYRNAPLLSAETALDQMLDGQMRRARELGIYPGRINSAELFARAAPVFGPDGALVVGLGYFGTLSSGRLISTLTQAYLRFALHPHHQARRAKAETGLKLTTLLIGQRDNQLTLRHVVAAMLEALAGANRELPQDRRIAHLEVLELYEDVASATAEALAEEAASGAWNGVLTFDTVVRPGIAGRTRFTSGRRDAWDQKVRISLMEDRQRFRFEVLTDTASVAQSHLLIARDKLDSYLENETASTRAQDNTGKLLFEWMLPRSLKATAADGRALALILDREAAGYPWELMEDCFDNRDSLIAVDAGITRQLTQGASADRPPLARTDRVCIIGDPESNFSALPAAAEEAAKVKAQFVEAGWQSDDLECVIGETGDIDAMLSLRRNRIIHFAGHGVHGWGEKRQTGLIIGKGKVFSPQDAESLRYAPEFVFLNCCHVGNVGVPRSADPAQQADVEIFPNEARQDRAKLAGSLAVSFISLGCKAVIAAGWEVDDRAAEAFADQFYRAFLQGETFAEAVRRGRNAARRTAPDKNTWGAYQCYGDPQFRLRRATMPVETGRLPRRFTTPGQLTAAIRRLHADSRYAARLEVRERLCAQLCDMRRALDAHPTWRDEPELLEALGHCAARLGQTQMAVETFEQALQCSRPGYSQEMVDRTLELRTRLASAAWRAVQGDEAQAKAARKVETEALNAMQDHLVDSLAKGGGMGAWRRWVRLGDTRLRLAAAGSARGRRRQMIKLARDAYRQADRSARERPMGATGHARIRLAFADYLLGGPDALSSNAMPAIKLVLADLQDNADAVPSYENARLLAEAKLFDLLNEPTPSDATQTALVEAFNAMFLSGASEGQRLETLGDLRTVAALLRPRAAEVATRVDRIIEDLDQTRGPASRADATS